MSDKQQNAKLGLLEEVYAEIKMNLNVNSEDAQEQAHVKGLIGDFIDWVTEISNCLDSNEWNGEDVMGIFFNEFNRYKKKSESGQVFTPDHITDFMYYLIGCTKEDKIFDESIPRLIQFNGTGHRKTRINRAFASQAAHGSLFLLPG